ncbi:hypothetical protein TURU_164407 [Turdus rufiventris]|nr:hypothetical protein TURU_164407 [Turdus rufiventris]
MSSGARATPAALIPARLLPELLRVAAIRLSINPVWIVEQSASNDILLFQGQSNTLDLFHSQSLPHQSPIVAPKVFSIVRGLVSADGSCR